jgi:SAM-dependent methyltransferase
MIDAKEQFKIWNLKKWEAKNKVMYNVNTGNKWPWFHDALDSDVEAYVKGLGPDILDVLDLGTCSGSQAIEIAKFGHRVVGTDVARSALLKAIEALEPYPDLSVRFILDDITASMLEPDSFNLILDRGCYHSICCFQHREFILNIKRILRPNGILLLKVMSSDEDRYVTYEKVGDSQVQMPFHFTEQEIHEVMSPHFTVSSVSDSFFYSSVIDPPARARFAILRNDE